MPNKLTLLVAGLLLQATLVQAQNNSPAMKVFTFDSVELSFPTISPDEKWLVVTQYVSGFGSRLMIRPLFGGPLRELAVAKGFHDRARFTPAGDRLVFISSLPGRDTTDEAIYLVSAPFDTRSGILTGPPRQISLDGVRTWGGRVVPVISPDGKSVAYVGDGSNAIKLIPVTGGKAQTLVDPPRLPESMTWSADGQFLSYVVRDGKDLVRMRVNRDGGAPVVLTTLTGSGPLAPDGQGSFTMPWQEPLLHWFTASGELLGEIRLPPYRRPWTVSFAAGGKYIAGAGTEWESSVRMVPVAGGATREMNYHPGEFLRGWNGDGKLVRLWTEKRGDTTRAHYSLDGKLQWQIPVPADANLRYPVRVWEANLVYWAGDTASWRLMALSLKDSSRTELARYVLPGTFFSFHDARKTATPAHFSYWQLRGDRAQLRAMRLNGPSQLVGEIPKGNASGASVFHNRIVYQEWIKDSVRVQLVSVAGRPPKTLMTFKSDSDIEHAWSYDGRLAVSAGYPRTLRIYRFDADGNVQGSPQIVTLPISTWSPIRWLPDGSGLTMLKEARATGGNEVVLVRLADPQHPILLTSGDPVSKLQYQLSPDGKFVLYRSTPIKESSIFVIDVAHMQRHMQMQKRVQKNK